MFARTRKQNHLDIWPGFVDALATLLMVIVFVLMTFVVAQLYLTDALKGKDTALSALELEVKSLYDNIKTEKLSKEATEQELQRLQVSLSNLQDKISQLKSSLSSSENKLVLETQEKEQVRASMSELTKQVADLNRQLEELNAVLKDNDEKIGTQKIEISTLNQDLAKKLEEIKLLNQKLVDTQDNNEKLEKEIKTYKNPKTLGLTHFRSEFFAKLMKIVGERQDIRVVGDRFVFQSEVLFDKGSAEIRDEGKKQLKHLARILKEITSKIPADIHWVLRIDGHTDKLPISQKFASNWELSSARAIAVVKQLIAEGIKAQHLVAAGFGEFHPLTNSKDETDMARNRRIEFKLDQR